MNPLHRGSFQSYARGIGIVLVVYGHVLRGLTSAGIVNTHSWLQQTDFLIYSFHMPLFFLLAGVNAPGSLAKGRGRFLAAKLYSILIPFVLWSLVQGSIGLLLHDDTNSPVSLRRLLCSPVFPLGQFWFLQALLICHLLYCALPPVRALLVLLALLLYAAANAVPVFAILCPAALFFPFYAAGVLASGKLSEWLERHSATPQIAASVGLFIAAIGLAKALHCSYQSPYVLPAAFLGILAVIQISMRLQQWHRLSWLARLGELSMTIYLLHVLASGAMRFFLNRAGVEAPAVHLLAGVAAGILLPLVLYRLLTNIGLAWTLGVRTNTRRGKAEDMAVARTP